MEAMCACARKKQATYSDGRRLLDALKSRGVLLDKQTHILAYIHIHAHIHRCVLIWKPCVRVHVRNKQHTQTADACLMLWKAEVLCCIEGCMMLFSRCECMHVFVYVCVYVCMYVYVMKSRGVLDRRMYDALFKVCMYSCICVCMYVCMCVCMRVLTPG